MIELMIGLMIGLDWIGLDWIGLDWIGLDWIGLMIGLMIDDWIDDWIGCGTYHARSHSFAAANAAPYRGY